MTVLHIKWFDYSSKEPIFALSIQVSFAAFKILCSILARREITLNYPSTLTAHKNFHIEKLAAI